MSSTDSNFGVSIVINAAIATACFVAFRYLAFHRRIVYMPRVDVPSGAGIRAPTEPPRSLRSWIKIVWRMSDRDCFERTGLDGWMLLRFLKFGIYMFAVCTTIGFGLLVPLHASGDNLENNDDTKNQTDVINVWSLANIPESSSALWAHVVVTYIYSIVAYRLLLSLFADYVEYRSVYFRRGQPHHHSIICSGIPTSFRSEGAVRGKLSELYNDISSVCIPQDAHHLAKIYHKRLATLRKLERAHYELVKRTQKAAPNTEVKRPTHRVGGYIFCGGRMVDAIDYYTQKLERLNHEVATLQERFDTQPRPTPCAIVTFKSLMTAAVARQCMLSSQPHEWRVRGAPEPRDLIWPNLAHNYWHRTIGKGIIAAAVFGLIFFYMIPIAFVQSLTNLSSLAERLPFLDFVLDLPAVVKGFIEGYLPTLIVVIFLALLPTILAYLTKLEGVWTKSQVQWGATQKMCFFQVVNVFFASIIAGSVFNELDQLISSPTSIVSLMGTSVPNTGAFFINFVMLQVLSALPLQLLQIGPLVINPIMKRYFAKTPREKKEIDEPPEFSYIQTLSGCVLLVLIGFTYSVVAPLISIFMLGFFSLAYLVYKYQLMYVFLPRFESGALYFPSIFAWTCAAVFLFQITIIGVLALKVGVIQSPLIIPLPVFTVLFYSYCMRQFNAAAKHLPLFEVLKPMFFDQEVEREMYQQPEFEHKALTLRQAIDEQEGTSIDRNPDDPHRGETASAESEA